MDRDRLPMRTGHARRGPWSHSRAALALVLLAAAAVAGAVPGPASGSAHSARARVRCRVNRGEALARGGRAVLFLRTTGPDDGKYGAPHDLLGCLGSGWRPRVLFEFEDGDLPAQAVVRFDGRYAAFYLGWSYTTCAFYESAGAIDCATSLFESVDLTNRRVKVGLESVRGGGPPLPRALAVTAKGWIAWISGAEGVGPLVAVDSRGQLTLDPGPVDVRSLRASGSTVTWRDGGVPHSALLR